MSHRPLTNTSSLKIAAAYCTHSYPYNAHWGGAQGTKLEKGQITAPCIIPHPHIPVLCTLGRCIVDQTNSNTKTLLLHYSACTAHTFLYTARWGGAKWTKQITGQINAPCIIPHPHIPIQSTLGRCTVDQTNNRSNQCTLHYTEFTHSYTIHAGEVHSGPNQ